MKDTQGEDGGFYAFGEVLKTFRKQKGIAQQEIAMKLSIHRNTLGKWERGDCLPESKTVVLELARSLRLNEQETSHLLEASLTALPPYWNVPYQRNPFFIGRKKMLQDLHVFLCQKQSLVQSHSYALSGWGGVGKTQTALEYAYLHYQDYSAVFWLAAETYESMISSFISIAVRLHLAEKQTHDQGKIVAAVLSWLDNHRGWLLIVDNVENVEMVKSSLPTARQGSLLFTTRLHTLGTLARIIELDGMPPNEARQLLLRRTSSPDSQDALEGQASQDESAISSLAAALDGLPLALDQAGAYVEKTHCNWSDFLHLFHCSPIQVLSERDPFADHPLSVERTVTLSFERLQQSHPAAADLLTLCCFLAPDAIPDILLTTSLADLGVSLQTVVPNPFQFNALLQELLAYSLISRSAQSKTITVHRLIQVILKQRMPEVLQQQWSERVIRMVNQSFSLDQNRVCVEQWPWCEHVLPHALLALNQGERWPNCCPERCPLLTKTATYLFQRARYGEAERFYQQALSTQEQFLGQEHPERAMVLTGLANTYQQLGQHQVSVRFYQQAIALLEKRLGPDHLEVALPLQGLAFLTFEMANYKEAEALYRRTLRLREQALPPEHPDIAASFNDLAVLCDNQGRYMEAERLYQRALSLRERAFGPDHLEVSESLNNLAVLSYRQARYLKAESYYQRALQIDEQKLGADHPQVGVLLNNLALLYRKQRRYEEAEPLYQRALRIRTQAFGPDHPYTAFFLDHLAALYREQGRYEEAEASSLQVLRIYEQNVKRDHPVVAKPLSNLALLYGEQGRYKEGEACALQALAIREQGLEAEHPDIASSLHDLAELYVKQSRHEEAEPLYQRALLIRTRVLGPDHPDVASLRERLTTLYMNDVGKENTSQIDQTS